ncbi:Putative DNA helicase ino80 [Sporothrix eucalyptigena]
MDNFRSTVLGRSHDDSTNGDNSSDRPRRRAIDILNPEPEPAASTSNSSSYPSHQPYASSTAAPSAQSLSAHRSHDAFALRSPSKPEYRSLASPSTGSARQASPASVGPAVNNLLNNSPPQQHRPPPSSVSRSRSPMLAPPPAAASTASTPYSPRSDAPSASRDKRGFYDPTTDTTAASSGDRYMSESRHRRDNSQSATAPSQTKSVDSGPS